MSSKHARRAALLVIPAMVVAVVSFVYLSPSDTYIDRRDRKIAFWKAPNFQIAQAEHVAIPLETFRETISRPLFTKSRKAIVRETVEAFASAKPAVPPPQKMILSRAIALGGVIVTPSIRRALLASPGGASAMWIDEGEAFSGWTVKLVDGEKVRLENGDENFDIRLYADSR